jgi:DNA-directed RNA polymerase
MRIEKEGGLVIETLAQSLDSRRKGDITTLKAKWKAMLTKDVSKLISEYSAIFKPLKGQGRREHYTKRFYPFLTLLQPSEWVDILVDEVAMEIVTQTNGLPINVLCRRLCDSMWLKKTMKQLYASGVPDKVSAMYKEYTDFICSSESSITPAREYWEELHTKHIMSGTVKPNHSRMPIAIVLQVGGTLLDVLLKSVTFESDASNPDSKPMRVFYHVYEFIAERKVGYVKAHPHILNLLRGTVYKIKIESDKVPMLVPPRPWVSAFDGGYLLLPTSLVRTPPESYHNELLSEKSTSLTAVCDAVNYVSQCSWRVNSRILNLIVDIFRKNGNDDLNVPTAEFPHLPEIPKNASIEERRLILKQRKEVKKVSRELYSLRMDMLYRLSLAKYFEQEVFWLPHNLDFRGRAYPIPPHLSHMSNDPARGILMFGEGRPLGPNGLKWLKIHLVNLHGEKKKASLEERAAYVDEIMDLVLDSADNPMGGKKWWQSADCQWQALAVCMEIASAIRSGNPEDFVSHVPVHQDGSCNGLQHYAALGRDTAGAEQVNLLPSNKPEDLYHAVAMMVEQKRKVDAEKGVPIAKDLEGKIHRKVVKQTVMTVVYGVTVYGGRLQVERQLEDDVSDDLIKGSSKYIVNLIFEVLRDMFSSARELQDWLTNSARQISGAGCLTEWVTPLGLPVVQPYTKRHKITVKTPLQTLSSYSLHSSQ